MPNRQPSVPARPQGIQQPAMMLTPKDIISILRRHIFLMIFFAFIGLIAGGISWYLLLKYAPKYTALTFIRVLSPAEKDPMQIGGPIVNKDIQYGHRLSIANLIQQQSNLMNLLDRDRIKRTEWFKSFGDDTNTALRIRRAFDDLKKRLGVSALRDAEFISISMTCGNKKEAALIVNEMVDMFLASYRVTRVSDVRSRLAELQTRRGFVESELTAAERSLDEVRTTFGFSDLEERNFEDTVTKRLNVLDEEEQNLRLTVSQLQANIATLEAIATGPINEQIKNIIERDPTMIFLTQSVFARRTELSAALTKFGEDHRSIRILRETIDDLEQRRDIRKQEIGEQTRQANLQDARDQLIVFVRRLEEAEAQRQQAQALKNRLDAARVEYRKRVEIRDQQQKMLNDLKEHIERLRIMAEDPETAKVASVGPAPEPLQVSSPLWYVYFPGGTFLGFALGIGLAFLVELLNDLLRTPRDVIRYVKANLLGVIPHDSEEDLPRDIDLAHIVRLAPYSLISESYRSMQINFNLSGASDSTKVIFITSCGAGDGKTTIASNFATNLAFEGRRVLLIDANLWRPSLHKIFPKSGLGTKADKSLKSDVGLSDILRGESSPEMIIRPSGVDGLDIIDAGPLAMNLNNLMSGTAMSTLIYQQKALYDHIIIDGPPVLLVSSAKILAGYADGTILVFNAEMTKRGTAQRAVNELKEVNAKLIGCVLLGARALKGGYFHEQFRSYRKYQAVQPTA
ncbi:MAG: polysaccharide biosynthesis tyrosine autokinase [Phycisphaerae bacterium]